MARNDADDSGDADCTDGAERDLELEAAIVEALINARTQKAAQSEMSPAPALYHPFILKTNMCELRLGPDFEVAEIMAFVDEYKKIVRMIINKMAALDDHQCNEDAEYEARKNAEYDGGYA